MYTITDLNDFEIQISDGFKDVVIWKQNIRFGGIDGDVLTLYWHNRAQTETRYELELDYNLVTVPAVASAAALQAAIEAMIISGWGGTGGIALAAGGVTASTGTVVFSNANSVTFGMAGNTVTASFSAPVGSNSSWSLSAGTQSATVSALTFADSNGVSFGLNNGTVTASHNGLTSQSVQPVAFSGSNGSFSFSTLTFGNLNGASFYSSNGSAVLSYTVPSVTNSSWTASAGTQSATVSQLVYSDSNGVSFGLNNGTITASHNGLTVQSQQPINWTVTGAATISNTSGSGYNFLMSGLGDITAGISSNTIYLSHAKNTHYITASNGSFSYESLWGAFDSNGISFLTTASGGTSGIVASHNALTSQSNQALSGSNGSFTFQTATFGNLNGVSFYTSNGSLVASHNGLTSQTVQPVAVSGSNGSFSFSTVTFGNLNGLSFYTSNGSVVGSYTVPAAGGALSFSAGTSSGTFNSLVFSNANSISFGLSGSTVTASYNDQDITLSAFPDPFPTIAGAATVDSGTTGATGGSTQVTGSMFLRSWQVPHPVVVNDIWAFNMHSITSAGTGSATVGHAIGLYTLNANTGLSLVSSFHWQMYVSQNSISARSHHWFWGNASNANSSALNGNVSASFTNGNAIPRRILISSGNGLTLPAGNYYIASMFTARTSGVNVFACSQAVEGVSVIASLQFMMGEANYTRFGGFQGAASSTFNMSSIAGLSLPNVIETSVISVSQALRFCPLYMARSKS